MKKPSYIFLSSSFPRNTYVIKQRVLKCTYDDDVRDDVCRVQYDNIDVKVESVVSWNLKADQQQPKHNGNKLITTVFIDTGLYGTGRGIVGMSTIKIS